jgi:monovalent cation/hydrogen antiporter
VLISCAAIVVRIAWVFTATYLLRLIRNSWRKTESYPAWQNVTIIAWTGMRGVVSLGAALALPLTLSDG